MDIVSISNGFKVRLGDWGSLRITGSKFENESLLNSRLRDQSQSRWSLCRQRGLRTQTPHLPEQMSTRERDYTLRGQNKQLTETGAPLTTAPVPKIGFKDRCASLGG